MRYQHWQRLLGALVIIYLFTLFAGTLGVMIFQNIQMLFTLAGIPLGPVRPLLLFIFTQLLVATVAPLLPMFALVFLPGATLAYDTHLHQQAIISSRPLVPPAQLIPLREEDIDQTPLCPQCGTQLKPNAHFCHHCGTRI